MAADSAAPPPPPTSPPPRLLPAPPGTLTVDSDGAARLVGISPSHLYALKRTGRFGPAPVRLGRCCRYRVAELIEWVNAGCPPRAKWLAMRSR